MTFEDFLILSANFGNRRIVAEPAAIPKASATDDFFSRHDDESTLEDDFLLDGVGNSSRL